jgi:hypothetical protein
MLLRVIRCTTSSQRAVASILNRKSIPYLDKAYGDKRRILREYLIKMR